MRKIIGAIFPKSFEKSYSRLPLSAKKAFKERRNLFLLDPQNPLLNNHALHENWAGHRSINITGDIRAVFYVEGFIAIFVAIGTHSQLYNE